MNFNYIKNKIKLAVSSNYMLTFFVLKNDLKRKNYIGGCFNRYNEILTNHLPSVWRHLLH